MRGPPATAVGGLACNSNGTTAGSHCELAGRVQEAARSPLICWSALAGLAARERPERRPLRAARPAAAGASTAEAILRTPSCGACAVRPLTLPTIGTEFQQCCASSPAGIVRPHLHSPCPSWRSHGPVALPTGRCSVALQLQCLEHTCRGSESFARGLGWQGLLTPTAHVGCRRRPASRRCRHSAAAFCRHRRSAGTGAPQGGEGPQASAAASAARPRRSASGLACLCVKLLCITPTTAAYIVPPLCGVARAGDRQGAALAARVCAGPRAGEPSCQPAAHALLASLQHLQMCAHTLVLSCWL